MLKKVSNANLFLSQIIFKVTKQICHLKNNDLNSNFIFPHSEAEAQEASIETFPSLLITAFAMEMLWALNT